MGLAQGGLLKLHLLLTLGVVATIMANDVDVEVVSGGNEALGLSSLLPMNKFLIHLLAFPMLLQPLS